MERQNLNLRMGVRRFTRLTNAFSKRLMNHMHALSLCYVHYNWCRRHGAVKATPAQAAGLADERRDAAWIVGLIDARAPKPAKPGPPKGSGGRPPKAQGSPSVLR